MSQRPYIIIGEWAISPDRGRGSRPSVAATLIVTPLLDFLAQIDYTDASLPVREKKPRSARSRAYTDRKEHDSTWLPVP
jgi:hypothetical protein